MDPLKDAPLTPGHHNLVLHHLLADLPDGQEMLLLHVVDCEVCRAEIGKCFVRGVGSRPSGKRAAKLAKRVRKLPGAGELGEFQAAVALAAELMALAPRAREAAVHEPRFGSPLVLEVLLQRAAAAQLADPERSVALAGVAERLAFQVYDAEVQPQTVALVEARAGNLAGNAQRLLGRLEEADGCLAETRGSLALFAGLISEKVAGGNDALARRVFEETLPHYALAGEAEQARLRWLEGKLTARLGRRDEGASLLARAWRLLLAEPSLGEATLCFLDLAAVLADAKRGAEVPALLAEMEAALAAWGGDPHEDLRDAVREITTSICKQGRERRKAVAAEASFTMRRLFRARGHRIETLPYA
ncbi:MAG TPA: hypothetical protein VH988_01110 [Thermoanaerobaculia bacterium]|jgi:hypothetical protein|nr:hypothetical protein [Thermoanaerobaculia bacterium]